MRSYLLALALLTPFAGVLAHSNNAHACGGCVVPPESNTIVDSHRMALAISPKQTVLWDQIRYKGDPGSWGWLLPVKPGAVVELSTDAWFETLDAATTTNVSAPPINCGGGSSGFGCGDSGNFSEAAPKGDIGGGGVSVVHRGTVGPFETVTLSTKTPGVLDDWLMNAGFNVPAESAPVIDAYVKEGFDFIALKLQPGKGVDEMKPVRVVQSGANPALPLRMVSVGTGANVAITLYVISEGRWEAKNFPNTKIPADLLAWDFKTNTSNYSEVRAKVLEEQGGSVWLTTFAKPRALLAPGSRGFDINNNFNFTNVIAEAYVQQGVKNGETTDSACASAFAPFANSGQMVTDPCPAGVPSYDASCGTVPTGETDARLFECGATDEVTDTTLDDVATALTGMHPKDVWITRMEASLAHAALSKDLEIAPAAEQVEWSADLQAKIGINQDAICNPTGSALVQPPPTNPDKDRMLVLFSMLGIGLLAVTRKRVRTMQLRGVG